MFCHLRPVRRLCLEKVSPRWFFCSRALSGAEAVNALRPFYFAVHPDFFGQHPREREVNETSLQRLSVYLETIQKPGFQSLKPTQLTFYVRETGQNASHGQGPFSAFGFRAVKFTLHTRDLLSTVLYILNSCSLSIEHVQSLNSSVHPPPPKEKRAPDRPIKWDKSYYAFTGFKDPGEGLEQVSKRETTLSSWLDNNGKHATKKLENSLPLRKELDRLKGELSHQLQLSDIRWQRSWGLAHRCSQLHSLGRLAQQNLETLKNAKGCTIIFTDRSGISAVGHVMLGTMDVHHHWTKLFERLPSYFDLQRRLMLLEDQIGCLLGGIQVVYIEELQPVLTLEEYYSLLDVFYNRLSKTRIPFHPRSLSGLQMILSSDRYAPSLHELGHFNVPTLCDPASLQRFILSRAPQARENLKRKDELKVIENELIQASTKKFSLEKFYKEPSVSSKQMVDCCKRLLGQSLPYLQGMHLCVSHFYSVMQDGDLCIPWNWKDGEAVK
ncbi:T-cell activation inhibitor, mitochondrial isoform X1 [Molossus molossus]|uniref:T cell activation inhibitor, mitochondrial n=2 Tax=Molossus molossus TaxID=27622 RepID=A0A7J8DE04_MOLMO|nr:T-cell activation inhibitor, mitochondrial isoform X1 [Molossus molossus]XP_036122728.1 T-cell activation inhibitor, mitochondrial isoform X1 [Molossus molossus]XP_036122729.1 T-cell activation inhibitor, mitochondrial isoform X1 [Molossus molossus]KAF6421340.1 T cell activation inhibitor, mitochondrial [Molossus molossus]